MISIGLSYMFFVLILITNRRIYNIKYLLLSLRVFGLLSSSLLSFPQRFGRYVVQPSSDVRRTQERTRNFKLRPLLLSVKYSCIVTHLQSGLNLPPPDDCFLRKPTPLTVTLCVLLKRCGNNNKDEDNSPKTLNGKDHQASSLKFTLLILSTH